MANAGSRPASGLANPIDLSGAWNATDEAAAARLHPSYRAALPRVPDGDVVLRGLPFALGPRSAGNRWLLVDGRLTIDLDGRLATHLVIAHFSDSWRDAAGERSPGTPVGWVLPTGEPLARYDLRFTGGDRQLTIRRRIEIADGIIGWGFLPFAALGHRMDEPLDWRGPHDRLGKGRYAAAGHAGPLTMLPGSWGPAQTGAADFVPTPDDDITLWLHVIDLDGRRQLGELTVEPLGDRRPGTAVIIGGLTAFDGTADPLVLEPRRQLLVEGGGIPEVDLGVAIRRLPIGRDEPSTAAAAVIGWGRERAADDVAGTAVLDIAVAPDARLRFGSWDVGVADLDSPAASPDGRIRIAAIPPADIPIDVRIEADGEPTPCRVRFVAADGRYLPPLGHRDEINPGLLEDTGAGVVLGGDTYAYVPGQFRIDLPPGVVEVEVVKGFDHRPERRTLDIDRRVREITIALDRVIDLRPDGWQSSDSHVHFLAPSTALLQAAAEDVNWVHLLATQLSDEFTSVPDLTWGNQRDPGGRHAVIVGTENRHNLLGHLALLGARRPTLPLASGGAPEGRIGAATHELMIDWAAACRDDGGLVVGAHFPLPYAEIAADIVSGAIDAIELQVFAPGLDTPSILEWYRFLNIGERLPVLGGTDKMSAEVPVGAVRTYARLDPSAEPTFDAWAAAVRAGRTFATSGPVIELSVEGREPGSVLTLPAGGGRLEIRARARAAQPIIGALEIVVNGRVVDVESVAQPAAEVSMGTSVLVEGGSWIAARSRSPHEIRSAFLTSMAAHTSPVYVEIPDRPLFVPEDAAAILEVIDGTARWLEAIATVRGPAERRRLVERVSAAGATLRERIVAATSGGF